MDFIFTLLFFLLGRWERAQLRAPARAEPNGRLGVLHHELDILHVPRRGEPNGVWQEDEEGTADEAEDEADTQEAEKEDLVFDDSYWTDLT